MKQVIPKLFKQDLRVVSLILVAWAFISPVKSALGKPRRVKDRFVITVGIYNYAQITPRELQEAERQAATFFAGARVRIEWLEYAHQVPPVPSPSKDPTADLYVRILDASKTRAERQTFGVDVMGESIIPSGTKGPLPGRIANVFYDRVKGLSADWGQLSSEVLGEAIAHELGHLLLGPQHSPTGIMKAHWTFQDQLLINRCQMGFLRAQLGLLQRAAQSLHKNTSLSITAQR